MVLSYAGPMARLLACPFCRELFAEPVAGGVCPECGVRLAPLEALPPSLDALADEAAEGQLVSPADRPLPWSHLGRARGALLGVALAGLASFFLPWVTVVAPYTETISGFGLAVRGAGWVWGGAAAWFVLIPLIVSRRTVTQMRGVRAISVLFAAMTAVEAVLLVAFSPRQHGHVTFEYTWAFGLYVSALLSVVGAGVATRFGGRADDLEALPWHDAHGHRHRDTSTGEVLH